MTYTLTGQLWVVVLILHQVYACLDRVGWVTVCPTDRSEFSKDSESVSMFSIVLFRKSFFFSMRYVKIVNESNHKFACENGNKSQRRKFERIFLLIYIYVDHHVKMQTIEHGCDMPFGHCDCCVLPFTAISVYEVPCSWRASVHILFFQLYLVSNNQKHICSFHTSQRSSGKWIKVHHVMVIPVKHTAFGGSCSLPLFCLVDQQI